MSTELEWGAESAIRHARLRETAPGSFEAVLTAGKGADASRLAQLSERLHSQKITTLLDRQGSEDVLVARGVKSEAALFSALAQSHCVSGAPVKRETHAEAKAKKPVNTRFLSGMFYNLGNIACIVSGIQRGRHNPGGRFTRSDISELMVGVSFSAGDVLMTAFSREQPDELAKLSDGFEAHLKRHGIKLPPAEKLNADSLHQSGAFASATEFARDNVISIKCLTEGTANLFMISAALKKGNFNGGKLAAGLVAGTGWFSTFLMDKFATPPAAPEGLVEEIKANPRGYLARPGAMANNIANLYGAYNEHGRFGAQLAEAGRTAFSNPGSATAQQGLALAQARRHDYAWNVVSACSFLVANYLFGISENAAKPQTEGDAKRLEQDMITVSANTLLKLPPAFRHAALAQAADYTAGQPHIKNSSAEIQAEIEAKMAALAQSRFGAVRER